MIGKTKFTAFLFLLLSSVFCFGQNIEGNHSIEFASGTFNFKADESLNVPVSQVPSASAVRLFSETITSGTYKSVINALVTYKSGHKLNDWLYYQLIRRTAQQLSPKKENYFRYTLYKWFLLTKSGYDARLAIAGDKIIFYVYNDEEIEDIPFFMVDGKKYMCLNYHDYGKINFEKE